MPTLNVAGQNIAVGDEFLKLSREKQNDMVDEIASALRASSRRNAVVSAPSYDAMGSATGGNEDVAVPEMKPSRVRDQMDDITKSIGGGLVRGTAGLASTVTDTLPSALVAGSDWLAKKLPGVDAAELEKQAGERDKRYKESKMGQALSAENVQKFLEKITGEAYQPTTTAGKFASTAAEFAPGGAIGKAPNIARNLVTYGVIPGLVSEGAGQAFEGSTAEPIARVAGALGAGMSGAAVHRLGSAERLVGNATHGVTHAQLDQMEALFQQAQQSGSSISRAEALQAVTRSATGIGDLQHTVEGMGGMKPFYAERPARNELAARQTFDNIAPPARDPASIGPSAGRAADESANNVRGLINTASEPFYKNAESVLLSPQEMTHVKSIPGFQEARDAVRDNPQINWRVAHLPDESVGFLNQVKKHFDQAAENSGSNFNPTKNKEVQSSNTMAASALKQIGELKSTDYAIALKVQKDAREKYLQPLLDGPLGKIAGQDTTTRSAIDTLFPTNPLPNSQDEIGQTMRALSKQRPGVANDLVRAHAEMTFNEATQCLASGGHNQSGGAKFAAVLRGNPQQAANLEAAVTALPSGDATWKGFNNLLDVMEAQQYRQATGSRTAFKIPGVEDLKSGGALNNAAQVIGGGGFKLPQKVMNAIQGWNVGRNVDQLAELLTNPASAAEFRRLATVPAGSQQAGALIARLVSLADNSSRSDRPRVYITKDKDGN